MNKEFITRVHCTIVGEACTLLESLVAKGQAAARGMTAPRCPANRRSSRPLARSQTRTVTSLLDQQAPLHEASSRPSGEKANPLVLSS